MLFGREGECARIDRLLADARGGTSGALVFVGEPGSGKSALLDYAVSEAGAARVVRARGVESESEFAYAGLHELVRPLVDALDELPPVQAEALRGALALAEPQSAGRLFVGAATLSLLAARSTDGALLCVVDDAHWFDHASRDALAFAARRLGADGIAMLFTSRHELGSSGLDTMTLGPLSSEAVVLLIERESGVPPPPAVAAELATATAGNPRGVVDLAARLSKDELAGTAPLPHPLPLGRELEEAYAIPAAVLSADAHRALVIAATADTRAIRVISRADAATRSAFEECEEAGLLTVAAGEVEFAHPFIRSAVYQRASPAERRDAHRALAGAFAGDERYAERRAWHAAAAAVEPDESVAAALESAAEMARARRGQVAAAAMYERAARLTPEPEPRTRRLYLAARSAWLAGQPERALAFLEAGTSSDPLVRADAACLRARIATDGGVVATLLAEAAAVEGIDAARAGVLLALAADVAVPEDRLPLARRAVALATGRAGAAELMATLALAGALAAAGDTGGANDALTRAKHLLDGELRDDPQLIVAMVDAVASVDPHDASFARELLDELTGAARLHAVAVLPRALLHLGWIEFESGRWLDAATHFAEAAELAREIGQPSHGEAAADALALLAVLQRTDSDERVSDRVRGLAELGRGNAETAAACLAAAPDVAMRGLPPVAVDLTEALVRAGRADEAATVAASLAPETPARRWAAALVGGEFEAVADAFADRPFLAARVRLCHGEALRRAGERRACRVELNEALRVFDSLGAEPWAQRARRELRASGGSAPRPEPGVLDPLTPQELQVARTVAAEATYKDAAAKLFLSPKTVEYHLRKVYRKLGITSGRQLAQRLAEEGLIEE